MTVTPERVDMVDVSTYQKTIDYAALHKAGVRDLYAKASEGTTYLDDMYAKHREGAYSNGLGFGAYHFAHTANDPVAEAHWFLHCANPKPGDNLPMLDLEVDPTHKSIEQLTAWRDAFLATIGGVLHVGQNLLYSQFPYKTTGNNILVRATYSDWNQKPTVPAPFTRWDIWQFSNGQYGAPNNVAGMHIDLSTYRTGFSIPKIPHPPTATKTTTKTVTYAPYTHRHIWRNVTLNAGTIYAMNLVEKALGHIVIPMQGSYSTSVGASAGTHSGGGAIDLRPYDVTRVVRALRAVGFAAWYRPHNWDNAGGVEHIHAILIGCPDLSPAAAKQVIKYRQHLNGLANNAYDNEWRPSPIPQLIYPPRAA